MIKILFGLFSFLLLLYLVLPGPSSIDEFPALPNSVKSTLSGDTWQVPNVAGYFSDNYRQFTTNFYQGQLQDRTWFPFLPIRLNYPPEYAYTAIKDQTESTYLEEYFYPLRESIFVNGFEPFYEDGQPKFWGSVKFTQSGQQFYTKATLRLYYSTLLSRITTWLGINLLIILLWKLGKKVISYE